MAAPKVRHLSSLCPSWPTHTRSQKGGQGLERLTGCWPLLGHHQHTAASCIVDVDDFPKRIPSVCILETLSLISELKQRLKNRGEQGSPCNTPLLTNIMVMDLSRTAILASRSIYCNR